MRSVSLYYGMIDSRMIPNQQESKCTDFWKIEDLDTFPVRVQKAPNAEDMTGLASFRPNKISS